ncbi:hypothetical protein [Cytobacillus purgationiresistens]|uniref:Uncharacterized protein n=1 Tax=Cytobacillus purgationiresistens TaxID=863449 RepID=A0ABU0AFT8_9BACI|nr:hypothetical protein [Cytobacillus purgationiresistens]MDQ0268903.1 hypothetical protein [Cytobacillus purgationiresistens]MDQ0270122.1 hypothetical protein [Cytobacillus purgationiresistens]
MAKNKRQRKWMLLFRKEEGQAVYLYERLQKHDLKRRLKDGWRIWY